MSKDYTDIYEKLKQQRIYQFGSLLSGSQYSPAYDLAAKYAHVPSAVLDWGTGSGHFSYFLLKQGHDVTAFSLDGGSTFLDSCSRDFPGRFRLTVDEDSVVSLPFEDASFDIVASIGVLEHVRETGGNEVASLREIKRVLKDGGYFLCFHFPNRYSWIEALVRFVPLKHSHKYKFTAKDVKNMTHECDLELLECRRYGLLPRNMFRVIPDSPSAMRIFNVLDNLLARLLNPICQSYLFVARKSSTSKVL